MAEADERLIGSVGQPGLNALKDVGEERVTDIRQDHPERIAASAHGARCRQGPVGEPLDRLLYPRPYRIADAVGVAQHFGDGCHRNPGVAGDLPNGGALRSRRAVTLVHAADTLANAALVQNPPCQIKWNGERYRKTI